MYNFLLVGHAGVYNLGCEAIVRTTIGLLNDEFDSPNIVLASFDYHGDKNINFGSNVTVIPEFWDFGSVKILDNLGFSFNALRKIRSTVRNSVLINAFKKADVVMSIGGDNFTRDYGFPSPFLMLNEAAKRLGKKSVIWAASIGPFNDPEEERKIFSNLCDVDLITARETQTYSYLKRGELDKNVKLTADPAFLLEPEYTREEGNIKPGNIFGLNISPFVERYGTKNCQNVIGETSKFIKEKILKNNFDVILIPHVNKTGDWNNDYEFMKAISRNFKETENVTLIPPTFNTAQIKSVISRCRFFMGARTHSTIASLSMGIPTISIGYSMKAEGINMDIFGNKDLLVDVKNFSASILSEKMEILQRKENNIKATLELAIPGMREMARRNIKYLRELVSS